MLMDTELRSSCSASSRLKSMPQVAHKTFQFKEAPIPNGRCKFCIYGYPNGELEKLWFRTEKEAKEEMKR